MSLDLIDTVSFDAFWQIWPRKVARKDAEKAWAKAVRRAKPDVIVAGARSYAASMKGKQPEYIKHASSWLNGDRWEDYEQKITTTTTTPPDQFYRDWINKGRNAGAWVSDNWVRREVNEGRINRDAAMKAGHPV